MKPGRNVSQAKTTASFAGSVFHADLGPDLSMNAVAAVSNEADGSAPVVNTASVTSTLAGRLSKGITHTCIGSRICVSVNPGRDMENREAVSQRRANVFTGGLEMEPSSEGEWNSSAEHFLQIVENAYVHVVQGKEDQSILLLGESGSGKSTTHQSILTHLVAISPPRTSAKTLSRIQVIHRIVEPFVNARPRTSKAGSSSPFSLFGTSFELQFSSKGSLVGAKTVLVPVPGLTNESTPTVFDLFLAFLSQDQRTAFHFAQNQHFELTHSTLVGASSFARRVNRNDEVNKATFKALVKDLAEFGFKQRHLDGLFTMLAVILHLSNLVFIESSDVPCHIKDPEASLIPLSRLFDINPTNLQEILVNRFIPESDTVANSYSVILSVTEAAHRRDALMHAMYNSIINWLVARINKKVCMEEVVGYTNYIQIVDFPGVSLSTVNERGFRDLLIKYTADTLQQIAGKQVYNHQHFQAEGIANIWRWERSDSPSALLVQTENDFLEALGLHTRLMNEKAQGSRDFDDEFLESTSPVTTRIPHERKNLLFRFSDSENATLYSAAGLVASNDTGNQVLHDLMRILEAADISFDSATFQILNINRSDSAVAISSYLIHTLSDLAESLQDTKMWVIAHIRISDDPINPLRLDPLVVARQARDLNLVEMCHSLGPIFTAYYTHRDFAERYGPCANDTDSISPEAGSVAVCSSVALAFGYYNMDLAIGSKHVFLSESAWRELEAHLGLIEIKRYESAEIMPIDEFNMESVNGDVPDDSSTNGKSRRAEHLVEMKVAHSKAQVAQVIPPMTKLRRKWLCLTWALTWWIPSLFLRVCGQMKRKDVQIAWREKVTLCIISATVCGIVLFLIIGLGRILCPLQKVLSQGEIDGMTDLNNPIVSMFGAYYQIRDIVKDHVDNQAFLSQAAMKQTVLGHDVSAMFYKTTVWSNYCKLPQPAGFDNVVRNIPKEGFKVWFPHQGNDGSTNKPIDYVQSVSYMRKGMVARDASWIQSFLSSDPINNRLIVAYGNVYDMSAYYSPGGINKFLGSNIGKIVDQLGASGVDATSFMEQVRKLEGHQKWSDYVGCMNGLFLTGVVDHRLDKQCLISNYIMLSASSILVLIIGLKFLTALQCTRRSNPENHDRFVLVQVPCYTEGKESLLRTFESVLMSSYLDTRKVLFVIADGMIVGSGNDKPTPKIVLDVLGWEGEEPEALLVQSLGDGMKQLNMAKVYSGYYAIQSKRMPYIVVSKVGTTSETNRPGNRGKRDSQLLIMKFLNRVHLDLEMNPMELELVRHFRYGLQIDPSWFEYILWIDADTEIYRDSINRLVACMIRDSRVVGVCGETQVGNEMESWVTMIQVYEYFISHHLSKQFESVFGSVTCLPGCFSMFRILSSNKTAYLISNDVIRDFSINQVNTLHLKNLLHLGEDRYLTTLMMKHFPGHKLAFSPDAKCKTQAPASWNVFVSQRRRWINSTVHTLFELMLLPQLCGCCLLSMRVVVFIDLFSTLAQPSALVYFGYLIYSSISDESHGAPLFSLIMIAAIYGVQLVIFMLKGEFQHLGWMVLYLLAIPIYSFYLPIYSFWHFDDFSWGNTRIVVDESGARVYEYAEENFDPSMIPLKKWAASEQEVRKQRNKVSPSNV